MPRTTRERVHKERVGGLRKMRSVSARRCKRRRDALRHHSDPKVSRKKGGDRRVQYPSPAGHSENGSPVHLSRCFEGRGRTDGPRKRRETRAARMSPAAARDALIGRHFCGPARLWNRKIRGWNA
ncbi:hypothetical protein MRX96_006572 [Rhipicephalus microplus]